MNMRFLATVAIVILVLVVGVVLLYAVRARSSPVAASPSVRPSATASPEVTKPPFTQAPLPLPTTVRWAVDRGSPDDPQHRSFLELFFDGAAYGFRVVDASVNVVLRFPIAGSGIFGPETCVARVRPQAGVTWIAVDQATLDLFMERYRTYRVVAEGIPAGEVTLDLIDSGCRPTA